MVESTKNKKTLKKVSEEVVKTKTAKNKDTIVKSSDKKVDKKEDLKAKKTISKDVVNKVEKFEKVHKVEKIVKSDKKDEKEIKNHDNVKDEKLSKKHDTDKIVKKITIKKSDEKKVKKEHDIKKSKDSLENHKEKEKKSKAEKVSENHKSEKLDHRDVKKVKIEKASVESNHDTHLHKPKKVNKKCIESFKNIFLDVGLLFKNFFHWNASKLIIFVWSIGLWFLSVLPIILIFFIYSLYSNLNMSMLIDWMVNWTLLNNFFWNVILMLIIVVFMIIYSYWNLLLINVYNSYLDWKKLSYKKNDYFDFKKVVKFFNLTIINFLILLVPVLIFSVLMLVLFFASWDINKIYTLVSSWPLNYFTILSLIFVVVGIISLVYIWYRTIFSYLVYLDEAHVSKNVKVLDCIKESFVKTKKVKVFFKFLLVVFIFMVITLPIKFVWVVLNNNVKMINDYSAYKWLTAEQKDKVLNSNSDGYYYQSLEIDFKWFNDEKLEKISNKNEIYMVLFTILEFLFLNWLFLMVLTSFYKRELN